MRQGEGDQAPGEEAGGVAGQSRVGDPASQGVEPPMEAGGQRPYREGLPAGEGAEKKTHHQSQGQVDRQPPGQEQLPQGHPLLAAGQQVLKVFHRLEPRPQEGQHQRPLGRPHPHLLRQPPEEQPPHP